MLRTQADFWRGLNTILDMSKRTITDKSLSSMFLRISSVK